MKKQAYEIDGNCHIKEIHAKEFNEQGNCLEELAENIIITDIPQGLYRAKWTGTEWVEDMPQAEIDALNNQPKPLTEIEQLRLEQAQANAELFEMMLMLTGGGL